MTKEQLLYRNTYLEKQKAELLEACKEAKSYILRQKSFNIKDSGCFHIANVMAQTINRATK